MAATLSDSPEKELNLVTMSFGKLNFDQADTKVRSCSDRSEYRTTWTEEADDILKLQILDASTSLFELVVIAAQQYHFKMASKYASTDEHRAQREKEKAEKITPVKDGETCAFQFRLLRNCNTSSFRSPVKGEIPWSKMGLVGMDSLEYMKLADLQDDRSTLMKPEAMERKFKMRKCVRVSLFDHRHPAPQQVQEKRSFGTCGVGCAAMCMTQ
jgi:hypothetical protein